MNIKILLLSIVFGLTETWHFGWNLVPDSDAEMICDGITMLLLGMAYIEPKLHFIFQK